MDKEKENKAAQSESREPPATKYYRRHQPPLDLEVDEEIEDLTPELLRQFLEEDERMDKENYRSNRVWDVDEGPTEMTYEELQKLAEEEERLKELKERALRNPSGMRPPIMEEPDGEPIELTYEDLLKLAEEEEQKQQ